MKKLFPLLSIFFFIGCGGSDTPTDTNTENNSSTASQSFQIKETSWNISLPAGWQYVAPPGENTPTVLLAQRQSANFVILQKAGPVPSSDQFLAKAGNDFYTFQVLNNTGDTWSFQGQLTLKDPLRTFYQKTFAIPGTQNYLYGSCSYENTTPAEKDCMSLLKNWNVKDV